MTLFEEYLSQRCNLSESSDMHRDHYDNWIDEAHLTGGASGHADTHGDYESN